MAQEVSIKVSNKRKYKQFISGIMSAQVAASDLDAPACVVDQLDALFTWATSNYAEALNPAGNPSLG